MKKRRLALIHTVGWYTKSVIEPFAARWLEENPDVEIFNIMDDSLLADSLAHGAATPAVLRRLQLYVMAAEAAGAEAAMITCTTVGEAARLARPQASIPVFNIDEPMAREAVRAGRRLGIVGTVPTSPAATRRLLELEARAAGREIELETVICEEAFTRLLAGDVREHDRLVGAAIDGLAARVDAIVLGQISLAQLRHTARVPILQVGRSGFAEARRLLSRAKTT
jgi:Asp/Glu/hydantoin racemase